jgi:hypothetical protein
MPTPTWRLRWCTTVRVDWRAPESRAIRREERGGGGLGLGNEGHNEARQTRIADRNAV